MPSNSSIYATPSDHSDRINESLQSCLATCLRLPDQAQREVVQELSYISNVTLGKEKTLLAIDKVPMPMHDPPPCKSARTPGTNDPIAYQYSHTQVMPEADQTMRCNGVSGCPIYHV